jgi:hypothetical protein
MTSSQITFKNAQWLYDTLVTDGVAVEGPVTDTELRAADVAVTLDGEVVVLGAGEAHIGTASKPVTVARVSITRPNDANVYAIGDAWSNSTAAPIIVPNITAARIAGGKGWLTGLKAVCSANQATKPSFQVLVFDTPFTALEDNAPVDLSDAEAARLVGVFQIIPVDWVASNGGAGAAGNLVVECEITQPAAFECLAGSQLLYVAVRLMNAYTPTAEEILTLIFDVEQA